MFAFFTPFVSDTLVTKFGPEKTTICEIRNIGLLEVTLITYVCFAFVLCCLQFLCHTLFYYVLLSFFTRERAGYYSDGAYIHLRTTCVIYFFIVLHHLYKIKVEDYDTSHCDIIRNY